MCFIPWQKQCNTWLAVRVNDWSFVDQQSYDTYGVIVTVTQSHISNANTKHKVRFISTFRNLEKSLCVDDQVPKLIHNKQ